MTTAHRPTFDPARGKEAARGEAYHQRLLPAHKTLKYRQPLQGNPEEQARRDLKAELLRSEAKAQAKKEGRELDEDEDVKETALRIEGGAGTADDGVEGGVKRKLDEASGGETAEDEEDYEAKKRRVLAETADIDADSDAASSASSEASDSDDDEEDETAQLMAELAKIKAERAEAAAKAAAEQAKKDEVQREKDIALGNPLLNGGAGGAEYGVKRRWDDDVVFKNQARGTEERGKEKRFVNDLLRSDFHRRFMDNEPTVVRLAVHFTHVHVAFAAEDVYKSALPTSDHQLNDIHDYNQTMPDAINTLKFGPPLPPPPRHTKSVGMADHAAASTAEATSRLQKAIQSAQEGNTKEALEGNIFVSQAIFAELLKKSQAENARLLEQVQSKDEEIRKLQAENATRKAQMARQAIDIVFIQAGKATRRRTLDRQYALSDLVKCWTHLTQQEDAAFIIIQHKRSGARKHITDPGKHIFEPQPPNENGLYQCLVFELTPIESVLSERKSAGEVTDRSSKKRKL